jgi:NAD(P)-dependent dehydrogenase (short-subunit alcohol dehydrogenase family)
MTFALTFPTTGAAWVVGGTGGLGAAICKKLIAAGSAVAFSYFKNESKARELVSALSGSGGRISYHRLDVRDDGNVVASAAEVAKKYDGIHTVIYASGPLLCIGPLQMTTTPQRMAEILLYDVVGCYSAFRAALPYLTSRGGGSMVAVTTCANHGVLEDDGQSAIPKAAVDSLVRQLAVEEGGKNIRFNSIGTGLTDAGMASMDNPENTVFFPEGKPTPTTIKAFEQTMARIRLGPNRKGTADELANATIFLASNEASYITGQCLRVDGGLTL